MIFIIAGILFGIGLGLYAWYDDCFSIGCLVGFSMCALGFVLGGCLASLAGAIWEQDPVWEETRMELYATADGTSTSGNFFLGTGTLNGRLTYLYYAQAEDGRITGGQVDARQGSVYMDLELDEQPYLIIRNDQNDDIDFWTIQLSEDPEYEFHVPEGTVLRQHVLDLEG